MHIIMTKGHFYKYKFGVLVFSDQNLPGIRVGIHIKIKRKVSTPHKL